MLMKDNLFEEKWGVLKKRSRLFRYIPFVKFVLVAGSMATGRVHEKSDFDVVVGVRRGRIFTSWFLSALFFEIFGWREKPGRNTTNKFGMSHFVAPGGYKLTGPYNAYWENLYRNLVPVLGDEIQITEFFNANDWLEPRRVYERHERYIGSVTSFTKKIFEFLLSGLLGDVVEKLLKYWLVKKIQNPARLGYKPRVFWSDEKLELYRDTKRIEEKLRKGEI